MRKEIGRTAEALLSAHRVAVEVCILSVISSSCMSLCCRHGLALVIRLLYRFDMLVKTVVFGELDEDVSLVRVLQVQLSGQHAPQFPPPIHVFLLINGNGTIVITGTRCIWLAVKLLGRGLVGLFALMRCYRLQLAI